MPFSLGILRLSESFSSLWPALADGLGVELLPTESLDSIVIGAPLEIGWIVAAGGQEDAALDAIREIRTRSASVPVAVVGVEDDYRLAQRIVTAGAERYIALPPDSDDLTALCLMWREAARTREGAARVDRQARAQAVFGRVLGTHPDMAAVLRRAARVLMRRGVPVLITGETGTGKGELARAIHMGGPDPGAPFVEINCAAIPGTMLEAELFGYERGAFTDAKTTKVGLFEAADGGTLFLDEIGDMPLDLQAKILKVLDNFEVRRLGGAKTKKVDLRLITATHMDLPERVQTGEFREDLFYRIAVLDLHLPPLRGRGEDLIELGQHFVDVFARELGIPPPRITPEFKDGLLAYNWPGNIRQLRNAIHKVMILSDSGLDARFLPTSAPAARAADGWAGGGSQDAGVLLPFPLQLEEANHLIVQKALEACSGNKSCAAAMLGISRKRLYSILRP